jgi:monovalent cation/proton antiporter MnhG/PhaG subunit
VDVVLVLAVLCELICVIGVAAGATVFDRIHYAGATTSVAPLLVLLAIVLRQPHPYTSPVWNGLFTVVVLFTLNNVLSHAIARVARRRRDGDVEL